MPQIYSTTTAASSASAAGGCTQCATTAHQSAPPQTSTQDGPFLTLSGSPDILITQGADTAIRICLELPPRSRPVIKCIGPNYISFASRVCANPGDVVWLTGFDGNCDGANFEGQRTVVEVCVNGTEVVLDPPFKGVSEEFCFTAPEAPLTGCIATPAPSISPRMVILEDKWGLNGFISYDISDGNIQQFGVMGKAGSRFVRTTNKGVAQVGRHITIQAGGVFDAEIVSVTPGVDAETGLELDIIELTQPVAQDGCYAAYSASGLLMNFQIESDGACQIAKVPAATSRLLSPAPGACVTQTDCDTRAFLGYYALFASAVYRDSTGHLHVQSFEVGSGCAVLRMNASSNVRLHSLNN